MKKGIFLILGISLVLLGGCLKIDDTNLTKVEKTKISKTGNSEIVSNTGKNISQENNLENSIIYIDSKCSIESCDQEFINMILEQIGINKEKIESIDIKDNSDKIKYFVDNNINKLPLLELSSSDLEMVKNKFPQATQSIKTIDGKSYLSLFVWEAGKENICNDNIDNDGNGLIDVEDKNCKIANILVDERCKVEDGHTLCDTNVLKSNIDNGLFPVGYKINMIDYSSEEGKYIYSKVKTVKGDVFLPIIIVSDLDKEINDALLAQNMLLEIEGVGKLVNIFEGQTKWNPETADICFINGEYNCSNDLCKEDEKCIPETKGLLEVYLMGFCPFGEIAVKQIPAIDKQFENDNIEIQYHYIVDRTGGGYLAQDFRSLHGVPEAEENIRQLCITDMYGSNKTLEYMLKRYENADNYGRVSEEPEIAYDFVGIDGEKIDKCITDGTGGKMLAEDMLLAQKKGITGSPTWVANGKYNFGGIDASRIITEFCKYNPELNGCKGTINVEGVNTGTTPSCN